MAWRFVSCQPKRAACSSGSDGRHGESVHLVEDARHVFAEDVVAEAAELKEQPSRAAAGGRQAAGSCSVIARSRDTRVKGFCRNALAPMGAASLYPDMNTTGEGP